MEWAKSLMQKHAYFQLKLVLPLKLLRDLRSNRQNKQMQWKVLNMLIIPFTTFMLLITPIEKPMILGLEVITQQKMTTLTLSSRDGKSCMDMRNKILQLTIKKIQMIKDLSSLYIIPWSQLKLTNLEIGTIVAMQPISLKKQLRDGNKNRETIWNRSSRS